MRDDDEQLGLSQEGEDDRQVNPHRQQDDATHDRERDSPFPPISPTLSNDKNLLDFDNEGPIAVPSDPSSAKSDNQTAKPCIPSSEPLTKSEKKNQTLTLSPSLANMTDKATGMLEHMSTNGTKLAMTKREQRRARAGKRAESETNVGTFVS
jgi:hypothetical protein